jgi:2-desacetyl-2-hydroxyethyl bacteriochlorophyllide A dehydrogenase
MKTRATILKGPKQIELVERDLRIGDDEVLVKTRLAGICGTDKNFYRGFLPKMNGPGYKKDDPLVSFPYYIGHEGGGIVVEAGPKVKRFKPGDFVMSFYVNGTMADYFKAVEEHLEPLPEGLSEEIACLGEAVGCAMFSGLHSNVNLGDTAVVYGLGFAGQTIAQCMKRKGAHRLIAVDVVDEKLGLARSLGADVAINALREDPVARILELTGGKGADVVAEVAGVDKTINQAIETVRHNGTLIFYSWVTQNVNINISRLHHDSITLINTGLVHHTREEWRIWTPWALRPVIQGAVRIEPLVNRRFKLDEVAEAFKTDIEDTASIKVVLEP